MRRTTTAALVLLVGMGLLVSCSDPEPPERANQASADAPEGPAATEGVEGVVVVRASGRNHVEGSVAYETYPPAGGDHNGVWHNCGFFAEPVPDELAVHSLEHGAVWIAYQPDLPQEQVDALRASVEGQSHLLVTPYPGLRSPLVLTAWERQLDLDAVDDARFGAFLATYLEGPTTPEPGAVCSGGAG